MRQRATCTIGRTTDARNEQQRTGAGSDAAASVGSAAVGPAREARPMTGALRESLDGEGHDPAAGGEVGGETGCPGPQPGRSRERPPSRVGVDVAVCGVRRLVVPSASVSVS